MRKSVYLALGLALAAVAWIVSGQLGDRDKRPEADAKQTTTVAPAPLQSVRVRRITATPRARAVIVNGRAEASRIVDIRSETIGAITFVGATEGAPVKKGEIIARIATEDRKARYEESKALLAQRKMEYKAAQQLSRKGYRSSTKLAESQAYLDAARAQLRRMQVEIGHTVVRAPFDGVLENRNVEVGAYVKEGDAIGKLVDLDPALIVANVSERDIGKIAVGLRGTARLIDGNQVTGKIRFVSAVADPATRSFRVELEVANPDGVVRDGVTSELVLPLDPISAYRISPAVLSLSEEGRVGVKLVDENQRVVFKPIRIIADDAAGVWVDGLPANPVLITVGHEFVKAGQIVRAVQEIAEKAP